MKTDKNIILGLIFVLVLFSCESHVGLGTLLDLNGPDVNFTSPVPRKAVTAEFDLEGTVEDYSGVKMLLIKVEKDRVELKRQWRYSNGGWEITDDSGANWKPFLEGVWEGKKPIKWSIHVNMVINGIKPEDGEYMFSAQAWDNGGVTDDKSFKTLVIIVDNDPPKVTVFNPLLYSRFLNYNSITDKFDDAELEDLRTRNDWRDPELIGKYQTNSFTMQWSIEDNFNILSFDLLFYEMSVPIDQIAQTPLPDDYIYRFHQNIPSDKLPGTPPALDTTTPEEYLKPNGSVIVPALDGDVKNYGENGELKKSIKDKTTIRVVGVCYDAANNVTQERTLGYLIYWPQADIPWITYTGDLETPEYYDNLPADFNVNIEDSFLVYPGRDIKAIAFHAQGVKEVTYSLYKIEDPKSTLQESEINLLPEYNNKKKVNTERGEAGSNIYSTSFSWDFAPPPRSAFYIVEAKVLSVSGKESELFKALFKVQDITFPDFPNPIQPPALEPFFKFIDTENDSLTIYGIVSDATQIDSLCLVWINPQSKEFAAQRQLQYFRDAQYAGWILALEQTPGGTYANEYDYDPSNPNKVWRLAPTLSSKYPPEGINPETQRVEYDFSITIPLAHLNIGIGKQPLKSQVFLLRASNPSPKTTIITYTPQGDESPPEIKITGVKINNNDELKPGQFGEIDKFKDGDEITIKGIWNEDSIWGSDSVKKEYVNYLDFDKYIKDNFKISINQIELKAGNLTFTQPTPGNKNGTLQAKATVGTDIQLANLKDTLVVAAALKDIGGNVAEDGASWLIKSDTLRLVRISSEDADQTYNAEKTIEIFIEFNKPVHLKNGGSPSIILNVTGGGTATAIYKGGQTNQNTRQYFVYNVQGGQSTTDQWLDVTGLNGLAGGNYWEASNYPFTWVSGTEEIRVTTNSAHTEGSMGSGVINGVLLRRLPVKANTADLPYTLANGKNIGIDTIPPSVQSISSNNKAGHFNEGSEININVMFSEPVKIANNANPPQLVLKVTNGGSTTVTTDGNVKVNDKTVTFSYTVKSGDTTGDNKVIIDSFTGGQITDIAGTNMSPYTFNATNGALNGGSANDSTGIYINTIAPGVPTFRALTGNNNISIINNNVSGSPVTGESAAATKDLKNYYGDELWFAIMPNTTGGNNRVGYLEYSLDKGINWKRIDSTTGVPFQQNIYGKYEVITRQTDKAGNSSTPSSLLTLNWDPGALVSRIDSSTANGTYTNNTSRHDTINVTVYFRKKLNFTATQITLNSITGSSPGTLTNNGDISTGTNPSQLSFTYNIGTTDNTPVISGNDEYLDVTAFNITATDADGVSVDNYINPPTENDNKLKNRKSILVQTGALAVSNGPVYALSAANDEASGTITLTFNRDISKRTGNITITQQTAGYRLPAILTEAQASRYKNARNFNTYYSRGTNGFVSGAPDTSTKFVLNYTESTVVTPDDTGTPQQQMAYDFLLAEKVTLPVSSQDVTVNGKTLQIKLTDSNALQVLGAAYDIVIPAGLVQDSLGYQWPETANQNYTYQNTDINRPFVRVDKKVNADRITSQTGSATAPSLLAVYSGLIQTTARLDCRTPNSIVRYSVTGQAYTANGATTSDGWTGTNWRNGDASATGTPGIGSDDADKFDYLTQPALIEDGAIGTLGGATTGYAEATTSLTVGTNVEQGYVWRISVRSRNGTGGSKNSELFEEIAFRTVLTYQISGYNNQWGQDFQNGDQLWIRGGDYIGSSSVPGFPINWQDDYDQLRTEGKRAGIRLLRLTNTPTGLSNGSVWRWITWEVNVRTWYEVVLARGEATGITNPTTQQKENFAWQYGPRQWAYQRGGWTPVKDYYTLFPGKHRWVTIVNGGNYAQGSVNFSSGFSTRPDQASVTITP